MQTKLTLEMVHVGLELLLQSHQGLLGLLQSVRAESSRTLWRQQSDLNIPQELDRLFDSPGVASQSFSGLEDALLKYSKYKLLTASYIHFVVHSVN